jgi:type IX secretion system PorP/SprF family membrane protein
MRILFTRVFFLIAMLPLVNKISAQQDPHYSQFMYNKLNFNAGFAGATDGKICATLIHRTQWMGFGGGTYSSGSGSGTNSRGGAPVNLVGSINAAIGNRFGIGATFASDNLGHETMTMPRLTLAYRHPLGDAGTIAAGVGVGFMQRTIDGTKLRAIQPDDPKIPTGLVSGTAPDVDFGLYYTKDNLAGAIDNFYAGLSATHLNQNKITYDYPGGSSTIDSKMHMYFVTGGELQLNSAMKLQPNILLKKDPAKIQADLNCFLVWNENIRGGVTFRPMDAAVLLVGYEFPFGLNVGYSYDITTSKIIQYSSGSHEIMLRYCFGVSIPKKEKVIRSRFTPRFM